MLTTEHCKSFPCPQAASKVLLVIHSSSHLGNHRGVANRIRVDLRGEIDLIIKARGGRMWDSALVKDFKEINMAYRNHRVLHVVLLGDNDVRNAQKNGDINPFVEKFGKTVAAADGARKNFEVFINGLIPFPIHEHPNSCELRLSYCRQIRKMVGLVGLSHKIHYVPLKEPFDSFCRGQEITAGEMFLKDRVHLSKFGEAFLADYIVMQARLYKASRPSGLIMKNLVDSRQSRLENYRKIVSEYEI